jgi:aspartyl-tRNA(Asn)/glutamyl-tRNA(Gln) amidotransferase subunit A
MDLTTLTLAEAANLIARRVISPVALTEAYLARITRIEPQLHSFITVSEELALARAREAEAEIQGGAYRGPLHGIPIAIKDLFETQGVRTTAGSKHLAGYVPTTDSAVVERLNAAGAVMLGKLNMHEWAMSVTTINPHWNTCCNPWNLQHIAGGSSGGAGAALAAHLCLGALGSDTAGSIRIPAAFCGVVGLKPTYGRVSTRGALPLSWNLDHAGPMARRVRDAALVLQGIAGYDPADPTAIGTLTADYTAQLEAGVRGWRVALAVQGFASASKPLDPDVVQAVRQAAHVFEQLGAQVSEVTLPDAQAATRATLTMIVGDAAAYHRERMQEHPEDFGADVLEGLRRGAALTAVDYALARRLQVTFRRQIECFFADYDILLTPTTPIAAPPIDEPEAARSARTSLVSFTAPFNLAGVPALSIPCGFTREALPIGLQLVARPWAEASVLRAGYAFEQATDWRRQQVPLIG